MQDAVIHRTSDADWDLMLKVHATAPFRILRAAAPYLRKPEKKDENRSIILISSVSGTHGNAGQVCHPSSLL